MRQVCRRASEREEMEVLDCSCSQVVVWGLSLSVFAVGHVTLHRKNGVISIEPKTT